MTTMKHEAATDAQLFSPSNENSSRNKSSMNQVMNLYVAHIALHQVLVYAWTWLYGLASKWTNTWTAWIQP